MLNELAQVVTALDRLGTATGSRHPRINTMGKNSELLIIRLAADGTPANFTVVPGETSATLFRVEHGAAGSSFPGFNLPTPLRTFQSADAQRLKAAIEALLVERKNTKSSVTRLVDAMAEVFKLSAPCSFTSKQEEQYNRSVGELVVELVAALQNAVPELQNLRGLIDVVAKANLSLAQFADALAQKLAATGSGDRDAALLLQDILFGALDWKKRTVEIGSAQYWVEKGSEDEDAKQPVYLDLDEQHQHFKPVAHPQTSELLNTESLRLGLATSRKKAAKTRGEPPTVPDAFTGEPLPLQEKYAGKTVATHRWEYASSR